MKKIELLNPLSFNQTVEQNTKGFVTRLVEAGWKKRDAIIEACEKLHREYWRTCSCDFFTEWQDHSCNACNRLFRRNLKTGELGETMNYEYMPSTHAQSLKEENT